MTFAAPLGLLALLAIPAIVAIHLLRRRFPVRPIAGLFLWQAAHDVPDGGRRIDKLPWTTSLLLECLAALALALIISGATLAPSASSEHLVVLLDDSVSMTAIDSGGRESTRARRSPRAGRGQTHRAARPHHPRAQRRAAGVDRWTGRVRRRSGIRARGVDAAGPSALADCRTAARARAGGRFWFAADPQRPPARWHVGASRPRRDMGRRRRAARRTSASSTPTAP